MASVGCFFFFFFPHQVLSVVHPLCQRGYWSHWRWGNRVCRKVAVSTLLPKKKKKKGRSLLLPATWEMISLKKNLSNRKSMFTVNRFLDPDCQAVAQELVLTQPRARNLSREEGWGLLFLLRLNACQRNLHCLWGLELLRMLQICENYCVKGQSSPLDTSLGSSIWKWLAQSWREKSAEILLLEIKSALTFFLISGICWGSWKQHVKDREEERKEEVFS